MESNASVCGTCHSESAGVGVAYKDASFKCLEQAFNLPALSNSSAPSAPEETYHSASLLGAQRVLEAYGGNYISKLKEVNAFDYLDHQLCVVIELMTSYTKLSTVLG